MPGDGSNQTTQASGKDRDETTARANGRRASGPGQAGGDDRFGGRPDRPTHRADCDLVMEGGVTSAVVYAGLLLELHRTHTLRSVGGTSAGAVAGAAGAIAEARRAHKGDAGGFERLDALLCALKCRRGGRTGLRRLFRPAAPLRAVFEFVLLLLRQPWRARPFLALRVAVDGLLRAFPLGAVAAPLLLVVPLAGSGASVGRAAGLLMAALALAVAGSLVQAVWVVLRRLPRNLFGLCTGLGNRWSDGDTLIETLHGFYNAQAGLVATDEPVRFAFLWDAPAPVRRDATTATDAAPKRGVDLQVITTAVELQQRIQLPGALGQEPLARFFYDPDDWARLFPAPVLHALRRDAPPGRRPTGPDGQVLWPLPPMARLPLVVAVRLSLSFPALLSAVPMYTLAPVGGVARPDDGSDGVQYRFTRVHFSDGGITSNCPVDLFDQPLPRHPTFTVNLYTLPDPAQTEPKVHWAGRNEEPDGPTPTGNRQPHRCFALIGFLWNVVMTGLEWRDRTQRQLPGARERVIHVGLPRGLGGVNLEMTPRDIQALVEAGRCAARKLAAYRQPEREATFSRWERHRWLRLRTTLAALQAYTRALSEQRVAGTPSYAELLASRPTPEPQLDGADAAAQGRALLDGAAALGASPEPTAIERQAPEPRPTLSLRPPT